MTSWRGGKLTNQFQFLARYPHVKPHAFLYAISGEDDAFRGEILAMIRRRHNPDDLSYINVETGSEAKALNALAQPPIKSSVIVEVGDFDKWKGNELIADWLSRRTYPNVICIFTSRSRSPNTKNAFAQEIIRKGWWVVCRRPTYTNMVEYVSTRFSLPGRQSEDVVDATGTDLSRVRTVITKLKYLTNGQLPDSITISQATMGTRSTVYTIADYIIFGRYNLAFEQVSDLNSGSGIASSLRRRATIYLKLRAFTDSTEPIHYISEKVGIPLFLAGGMLEKSKAVTTDTLIRIISLAQTAESQILTEGFDSHTVLKLMILKIMNGRD